MRQDLLLAVTLDQYRKAIERRYDKVETLLEGSIQCSKADRDHREQWFPLKKALGTLRSNARKLAFTEFDDWMRVRERELGLLEPLTEKPESLQAQKPLMPEQPEKILQQFAQ